MNKKYSLSTRVNKKDYSLFEISDKNIDEGLIGKLDVCFSNFGNEYFGIIKDVNCELDELRNVMDDFAKYFRFNAKKRIFASLNDMKTIAKSAENDDGTARLIAKTRYYNFYIHLKPDSNPEASVFCYYIPPVTTNSLKEQNN